MTYKNLVVALVATVVMVFASVASADQVKFGPKWIDGHSYDGQYGVNNKGDQSWGFGLAYEKDGYLKRIDKHQSFGIDAGVSATYQHITITDNRNGRDDYEIRDVNSVMLALYPKAYYELHGVRVYVAPMLGGEIADDGESAPMLGGMVGIEKMVTKKIGVNIQHEELWTMKRRFDVTSANIIYRW